jgi:hypothetical protein
MLAIVFTVLLTAILGLAYSQIASALRVETARTYQVLRDEGNLRAIARALALLETGPPPQTPYVGVVTIDTSTGSQQAFTVTITTEGPGLFAVTAAPATAAEVVSVPQLDATFGHTPPP